MNLRLLCFLAIISLVSCKKDKLTKEYAVFKGTYEWIETPLNDKNISSNNYYSLKPGNTGYSVSFELNDRGEAIFYRDGSQISKNAYTITEKESSGAYAKISIKLKGSTGSMVISKSTLTLRLSGDSQLEIDEFPFPCLDNVENYKPGYGQSANKFLKN